MRWRKRSARDNVLQDIHLGKKAQRSFGRGESSSGSERQGGGRAILYILLTFLFISGAVVVFGFFSSDRGQRAVEGFAAWWDTVVADRVSDYLADLYIIGAGDYFSSTVNRSSTKQGIDLESLTSLSGSSIPGGTSIDLQYDLEFYEVKSSETFDEVHFTCSMNVTKELEADDTSCTEDAECGGGDYVCESRKCVEKYTVFGEIIPETPTTIKKGSTVLCRINGEDTADIPDGESYTIYGGVSFPYETVGAAKLTYFITESANYDLEFLERDFWEYNELDISNSDLSVVYNGEPIGIAMGFGGESGKDGQPVIVPEGETFIQNALGITLENKWSGGTIVSLEDMILYLPDGVTLDAELSGEPSLTCPFVDAGRDSATDENTYVLDVDVAGDLFDFYIEENTFWGKDDRHTFTCFIDIEEDFVGAAGYEPDTIRAEVSYVYEVAQKNEQITILATGGDEEEGEA